MIKKISYFLFLSLIFIGTITAFAEPLPPDQAFQVSAAAKDYQTLLVYCKIAPNYYLYQQHFRFDVVEPKNVTLGKPLYPSNTKQLRTTSGNFAVYANTVIIPIPIINATQKNVVLQVHYQGCSASGYCYPPTTKLFSIPLTKNYLQPVNALKIDVAPQFSETPKNKLDTLLDQSSFFLLFLSFFGLGVLLSLTPCVLPMIPILSSMILGKEKITHAHAFFISLFYVLGMAITYAIAGILFGMIGETVQSFFQQPWIIATFSALFVLMALSLFGLFTLELPNALRSKIANISQHQKRGTYIGAAIMGILSTLILSPCVTPPLVAVLGFISQTGDAALGGVALFAMGIGMGVPLLLIGALGSRILPKSGSWMNTVKNIMGIFLLAVAIFMLQRIVSEIICMLLWALLSLSTAIYLGAFTTATTPGMIIKKSIGILLFGYGLLLMIGAYHDHTNPLQPFSLFEKQKIPALAFTPVYTTADVDNALATANNRVVVLDFYADWCVACKELDSTVFRDPAVQAQLSRMVLLRADVTDNSAKNQLIEKHYGVVAPPTILFFKDGQEIPGSRVIGLPSTSELLRHFSTILR